MQQKQILKNRFFFISSGTTEMSGCTPKGEQLYVRDEFSKKINWSETIKCGVKTV